MMVQTTSIIWVVKISNRTLQELLRNIRATCKMILPECPKSWLGTSEAMASHVLVHVLRAYTARLHSLLFIYNSKTIQIKVELLTYAVYNTQNPILLLLYWSLKKFWINPFFLHRRNSFMQLELVGSAHEQRNGLACLRSLIDYSHCHGF